ncbi:MAG: ABC transporter substrate-binding protein [Treponema sp.]|nr:ABC transporter substrate-binding protein [Treponema sp.]
MTAGCSAKADKSQSQETAGTAGGEFISIIDQNNMEALVPKGLSRIVMTALPLPSVYALTGAPIEYIVGMHPGSSSAIENSVMAAMYPNLLGIPSNFIEGQDINVEELLKLSPDAVLYWAEYTNQYNVMHAAGIPVVGVKTQGEGDAITTLESWLRIMAAMVSSQGNADKVLQYGREIQQEIREKTGSLPDSQKPRTLMLYGHSAEQISAGSTGEYGGFWVESTGGINVAREIRGNPQVNMEQVYAWDPDIIIITTFSQTMPEDLYSNTIPGQDWSHVKAVANKKVFKEPLGVYRWYPPSGDAPLMVKWMAQVQHPDLFTYDMREEVKNYYKEFYDYTLTDGQVEGILSSNPESARGADWTRR